MLNLIIFIIVILIIIISLRIKHLIFERFADEIPRLNQDPYMSCFLIKDESSCNNNNKIYNFVGSLSKCKWMNDYCGPVRTS